MIKVAESESYIRITRDTPYLALTGELWGIYCEDLGEKWPSYNGTAPVFKTKLTKLPVLIRILRNSNIYL